MSKPKIILAIVAVILIVAHHTVQKKRIADLELRVIAVEKSIQ